MHRHNFVSLYPIAHTLGEIDGKNVFIIISCGLNGVEKLKAGCRLHAPLGAGISCYIPSSTCAPIGDDPWPCALPCCHSSFVRASLAADRTSPFPSLRAWINGSTARVSLIFPRASAVIPRTKSALSLRALISGSTAL